MKNEFFVVGDVHGEFELLLDILKKWDEERQQLIFLGDLIDRGKFKGLFRTGLAVGSRKGSYLSDR
jgi:predicted phosphodiesterase